MKARTVSDRSRHRNHRITHKAADNTRQRALHTCSRHYTICLLQQINLIQKTVNPAHANIVKPLHMRPEKLRRLRRLLRNGNIGSTRSTHNNAAATLLIRALLLQRPRHRIINNIRQLPPHQLILLRRCPRAEHLTLLRQKTLINIRQIRVRLTAAVNHLRKARALLTRSIKTRII